MKNGMRCSHVRRMPMSALLASADRLPVVVRIPAGPLGSLKCDPPKGNGRRPQKRMPMSALSKQDDWRTKQGTIAGTCMVPCERHPSTPANSGTNHPQSPASA